jgi:hypothetical protein
MIQYYRKKKKLFWDLSRCFALIWYLLSPFKIHSFRWVKVGQHWEIRHTQTSKRKMAKVPKAWEVCRQLQRVGTESKEEKKRIHIHTLHYSPFYNLSLSLFGIFVRLLDLINFFPSDHLSLYLINLLPSSFSFLLSIYFSFHPFHPYFTIQFVKSPSNIIPTFFWLISLLTCILNSWNMFAPLFLWRCWSYGGDYS